MPIQATPRNKLLGLLADGIQGVNDFARKPFGYDNPPAGLLMDALSVPAVAATVDRLSYGEPLTTGKGWARQMRPETSEAALAVVPAVAKYPKQAALVATGLLGDAGAAKAMFIGASAKTWDAAKAAKAAKMEKAGEDARKIWSETGTFKGVDGKWRQEIDDSGSSLRDYQFTPKQAIQEAYSVFPIGPGKVERIAAARPYSEMTTAQLRDEFKRTGGEIVDAATSGNMDKAKELMSARSGLDDIFRLMSSRQYGPASSFLRHPELGAAYPDVYKLHTRVDEHLDSMGAYKRGNDIMAEQMVLRNKPNWSDDKSTMLHELQHAIQNREGFARGGNPEMMDTIKAKANSDWDYWSNIAAIREEAERNGGDIDKAARDIGNLFDFSPDQEQRLVAFNTSLADLQAKAERARSLMFEGSGFDAYRRLAGEAEARATQARMNMTQAERLAKFPFDSYDVPVDSLLLGP